MRVVRNVSLFAMTVVALQSPDVNPTTEILKHLLDDCTGSHEGRGFKHCANQKLNIVRFPVKSHVCFVRLVHIGPFENSVLRKAKHSILVFLLPESLIYILASI